MKSNPTRFRLRKTSGKTKGLMHRILLPLMDGKEHEFNEYCDWVASKVPPERAIRNNKYNKEKNSLDSLLDETWEGRRVVLLNNLLNLKREGAIEFVYIPEPDPPRFKGARLGIRDVRKYRLKITEKGKNRILHCNGGYSLMASEMYSGLINQEISLVLSVDNKKDIG